MTETIWLAVATVVVALLIWGMMRSAARQSARPARRPKTVWKVSKRRR